MLSKPAAARPEPIAIYVDADACPVKDEVYRVAERHGLHVHVVSNAPIAVPRAPSIHRVVVPSGPDVADDYIAERVSKGDVVITADIPLASRCVKAGADVIAPTGRAFTEATIGDALATRNLMDSLRSAGQVTSGPRPFSPRDRSAFLSALDLAIVRLKRAGFVTTSQEPTPQEPTS
ncbi:YaiI/YqxD family protein [Aquabacter sp. CN5-332]|uniref:YaiI/YqxD family protein n=1 Tax=Aquabacter sp. CN5-332 TaxID=3156608 RepID=UPI0032B41A59